MCVLEKKTEKEAGICAREIALLFREEERERERERDCERDILRLYVCVEEHVCFKERERERERETDTHTE
jgi:hypothetical protein